MVHLIGLKEQEVNNVCFSLLFFLDLLWRKAETKAINSIYLRSVSQSYHTQNVFVVCVALNLLVFQIRPAYLFPFFFLACEFFVVIVYYFKDMVGRTLL